MMAPARQTLALWPRVHELEPGLRLQIVPVGDLYVRDSVMTSLGGDVDVLQSSYSTVRWGGSCRLLRLFDVPFYVDVPRASPLAGRASVGPADLRGVRLRVLRHGNDAMDDLRDLLPKWGVEVADVDSFDFALFNDAEAAGDAVLTCGAWSGFNFVGSRWSAAGRFPASSRTRPAPHVARFVRAMRAVTSGAGPASHRCGYGPLSKRDPWQPRGCRPRCLIPWASCGFKNRMLSIARPCGFPSQMLNLASPRGQLIGENPHEAGED